MKKILFLAGIFFIISVPMIANGGEIVIQYSYDDHPLVASSANAYQKNGENRLIGKAKLRQAITEGNYVKYFEVEENHYSPDGKVIYTCVSKFKPSGDKISETKLFGNKVYDLFRRWPVSSMR